MTFRAAAGLHKFPAHLLSRFHMNIIPSITSVVSFAYLHSKMERLTFFFDGVDNAPAEEPPGEAPINTVFESTVADTLRQYLQPKDGLSLTNAALAIISLLPETPRPAGLSEEYPILWELCVNAAEQIPYHHVCQMKLARLVIALRHSPKITATYIWVSIPLTSDWLLYSY